MKDKLRMLRILIVTAAVAFSAVPALADRPVTDAERTKLVAALAAQGCSAGEMEWDEDDREFEVDDADCGDGRDHDLKFNANYTLKSRKVDD